MNRGDHIKVFRGPHSHHGIYIGNGRVIHYTGAIWQKITGERDFSVRQDSLETFRGSGKVVVVKHKKRSPADIVVKRARARLGEKRYNLATNNCEHFATKCATGEARSKQVERASTVAAVLTGTTTAGPVGGPLAFAGGLVAAMPRMADKASKSNLKMKSKSRKRWKG